MNMIWLYEIPTWLLGIGIIGLFVLLSSAGLLLTRGWAKKVAVDNDFANYFLSAVGVFYALLVGLIAVAVWENLSFVEGVVADEAVAISEMYSDLEGYPQPQRDHLRGLLRRYLHHVIEQEWPVQQKGEEPTSGGPLTETIVHEWMQFEPVTEGQKAIHAEALRELNVFLGFRRERLQSVETGLPGLLWVVVLMGAALTIGLTYFFYTENRRLQLLLTGVLSTMVGLVVFVILAMDRPLIGELGVPPDSFREVLAAVIHDAE
ncbi:MAG TPA: hypothetical protein VF756_10790 [Thermoanaerobaculia bacterium]